MENGNNKRLHATLFMLVALAVITCATGAFAQSLSLMAPAIANEGGMLTARFGVTVEEKPILKGELEDGAELVLKCDIGLFHVSDYWFDNELGAAQFVSVIKYEPLTKEFVLTLPDRDTPLRNTNLPALLKEGWSVIEAGLVSWAALERGEQYSLVINTTMNEVDAPEGLSKFIYFWSWDTGADTTFLLNFIY